MDAAAEGKELIGFLESCKSKRPNSESPWKDDREKSWPKRRNRKIFRDEGKVLSAKNIFDEDDLIHLETVCKRAHYLDQRFHCCCFGASLGWSAIIGLIPIIGDVLEIILSISLVKEASKIKGGLPGREKMWMYFYIVLDYLIGFVPILGDLFDVGYRANTRIAWLLNDHLVDKAIENIRKETGQPSGTNEPKDRDLEQGIVRHVESFEVPMTVPPARTKPQGRNLTGPRDPRNPYRTQGRRH
ncbi:uncharacterized protein P884DRAFT_215694 [Thermothelomyces heterothallicus CBS 202.75]|uniref:uncharacterized protein n=1 Tax=Thermothelomyces heterothallicus CBS 202.75 TaxID=1149848 RepID=UPI003744439B